METAFTPAIEIESATLQLFNFTVFRKFLIDKNILPTAIGIVIGTQISKLTDVYLHNIVDPFFEPDMDGDGNDDLIFLKKHKTKISCFEFGTGEIVVSTIKFLIVLYLIFIISRATIDLID